MLTASAKPKFPPIEADIHEAVCYSIIDIGTHTDEYQNQQNRRRKVVLTWEIPGQRIQIEDRETGEKRDLPRAISNTYTFSLDPKATLRKHLVAWRTRDFTPAEEKAFEMRNVLGASCRLNIIHKPKRDGSLKAVVDAVFNLKGKKLKPENTVVLYGIEENGADIPSSVPEWIVREIKSSEEWQTIFGDQQAVAEHGEVAHDDDMEPAVTDDDSSIPF